jgi:hypothetical protein
MVQATEQYWMAQVKDLEQQLVREKAKLVGVTEGLGLGSGVGVGFEVAVGV